MADRKQRKKARKSKVGLKNSVTTALPIHTIYFYYLKFDSLGEYETRLYYQFNNDTPIENLEHDIATLAINAYRNGNNPPCLGGEVDDLYRRRKSYFVVVVEGWALEPIAPMELKRVDAHGNQYPSNHTFSHPQYFEVTVANVAGRKVILPGAFCLNVMQSATYPGSDLGEMQPREFEDFELYLNLVPPVFHEYPDSGGTNMGPPIGPP